MGLAALVAGAPALAEDKAAPKKGAPPAASAATKKQQQSAWVKLCEKASLNRRGKDGKDVKEEKNICLTHHERLDGNTGAVLVSAAVREVDGSDKKSLMIMVPLGMAIPPGIRAAVYTKDQWAKIAKKEKIDEKALKPFELKFSLCHAAGCTAETIATKEIIDQIKSGGGIMVIAMNAGAKPVGFPVPLAGFAEAYAGKPIDNKEYAKARGQLMAQIRKRQAEAYQKRKAEKMKLLPPQPGTGATVKDAPAKKQ